MTTAVIELNDQQVRAALDGSIVARSPGCAIVSGADIQIGDAACVQAHLYPRDFYNKFWYQLNQASLRKPTRSARHHADLAYKHLAHVHAAAGSPPQVIFAVPGGYTKDQLALLLGIAQACKINTVALVDAAVASAAASASAGRYQHVEIEQHRSVVTDLDIGTEVLRDKVDIVDGAGFDRLNGRFVAYIADEFLTQSRFDPLHQAHTEQLLFNEIPQWLEQLRDDLEIQIHIEFRSSRFEARITRAGIVAAGAPIYREIRARLRGDTVLVGSRLAAMAGFLEYPGEYATLPETAVFTGCQSLSDSAVDASGAHTLITRLPAATSPSIGTTDTVVVAPQPRQYSGPTHLLSGVNAFELGHAPIFLNRTGQVGYSCGASTIASVVRNQFGVSLNTENDARVLVNGVAVMRDHVLSVGDRITAEGADAIFLPIHVVPPDAS